MKQIERLQYLVRYLMKEGAYECKIPHEEGDLFALYRSLVNVRQVAPISEEFLKIQDEMLQEEKNRKGIINLPDTETLVLWKGDITRLHVDAIVNAANSQMEGCFIPGHSCIDNVIHTYAGIQLREECHAIMCKQGNPEPVGHAKITRGYNLPCSYILHTVGPMIQGALTREDEASLASCYTSCLQLAEEYRLQTVAFCCISTGVFHFPRQRAAEIAVQTVSEYLRSSSIRQVIFNVFLSEDELIYKQLLKQALPVKNNHID